MKKKVSLKKSRAEKRHIFMQKPSGSIAIAGDLTLIQRKFYNAMLKRVKEALERNQNTETYTISLNDLKKVLGDRAVDKHNQLYKQEIEKMFNMTIEYNILSKDKLIQHEIKAHLLDNLDWKTNVKTKEVELDFTVPIFIRDAIKNIIKGNPNALYANIDLMIIKGLKRKYSVILYEICKDYEKAEIPTMTIQQLRKVFGIENKKMYRTFNPIKNFILDPSIAEINSSPEVPFKVSYKLIKKGRAYTHIKFIAVSKYRNNILNDPEDKKQIKTLLESISEKYRNDAVKRLLQSSLHHYSFQYVLAQVKYTNKHKPREYIAYLKQAIADDFANVQRKEKEIEAREKLSSLIDDINKFNFREIPLDGKDKVLYEISLSKRALTITFLHIETGGAVVISFALPFQANEAEKELENIIKNLKASNS